MSGASTKGLSKAMEPENTISIFSIVLKCKQGHFHIDASHISKILTCLGTLGTPGAKNFELITFALYDIDFLL